MFNRGRSIRTAGGFRLIPPRDGGWSLSPMVNLLKGLRDEHERFALEVYSQKGAVYFGVRAYNPRHVSEVLQSAYPQAHVEFMSGDDGDYRGDWLHLAHGEFASVMPMWLAKPSWLPLATPPEAAAERTPHDPLASLFGGLAHETRPPEHPGSTRMGVRIVIQPAPENWGRKYQDRMQKRRDGEDRNRERVEEEGSLGLQRYLLPVLLAGLLGVVNWKLLDAGQWVRAMGVDLLAGAFGGLGYFLWSKIRGEGERPYLDETLIEEKLKALGFYTEIQVVYIDEDEFNGEQELESLHRVADRMRQFDDAAGNQWGKGRIRQFTGEGLEFDDPGLARSDTVLDWLDARRARASVLSAREIGTLWHPPLGEVDMVPMERSGADVRAPLIKGLDHGALVGHSYDGRQEIRIPDEVFTGHGLAVGGSGVGKSTLALRIISDFIQAKERGENDRALLVLDPHSDMARQTLELIPDSLAHLVKYIDLGHERFVPALNLLDPAIFPHRDRCVDSIVNTIKALSGPAWGNRVAELLSNCLKILYEANQEALSRGAHDEMLTILDVVPLIGDGKMENDRGVQRVNLTRFQRDVLSRVRDFNLKRWFNQVTEWTQQQRSEAIPPVTNRIGRYLMDENARVILGQRESSIKLNEVLEKGEILLVSTAQSEVGEEPAAVMGGTMVSLINSTLLAQGHLEEKDRKHCFIVCDEFQSVPGAPWEQMFAEARKFGGHMFLLTQGLARLETSERKLKEAILANTAFTAAYRVSGDDAAILSRQLVGTLDLQPNLVSLDSGTCYMKVTVDRVTQPVFTLRALPPPSLEYGTVSGKGRVLELMSAYSVDRQEALSRMAEEVDRQVRLEKIGAEGWLKDEKKSSAYDQLGELGRESRSRLPKALDGIPAEDIEASKYDVDLLAEVVRDADKDPGLRGALDKRNRGRTKATVQRELDRKIAEMVEQGLLTPRVGEGVDQSEPRVNGDVSVAERGGEDVPDLSQLITTGNPRPMQVRNGGRRGRGNGQRGG